MRYFLVGIFIAVLMASCMQAIAHEMVPTYPKWERSHLSDVAKTTMKLFNKREDVEYYEIGVFDKDFNSIPFVSQYKIFQLKYLEHISLDVYIRNSDIEDATYICSKSKIRKDDSVRTAISSKICSKFK